MTNRGLYSYYSTPSTWNVLKMKMKCKKASMLTQSIFSQLVTTWFTRPVSSLDHNHTSSKLNDSTADSVAQWIAHRTQNHKDAGSTPTPANSFFSVKQIGLDMSRTFNLMCIQIWICVWLKWSLKMIGSFTVSVNSLVRELPGNSNPKYYFICCKLPRSICGSLQHKPGHKPHCHLHEVRLKDHDTVTQSLIPRVASLHLLEWSFFVLIIFICLCGAMERARL